MYYILKPASDTIETGHVYPQVQKMSTGYDYKAPNSVHALSRIQEFPDFEPDLDYFVVHGKAKLSDMHSVTLIYGGFLISRKLKEILETFNLVPHRFYPARVYYKKTFHEYYWMHIVCNFTDIVDYPTSSFFIYYNFGHNLGKIDIASKEDVIQKRKQVKEDNPGKTVTVWAKKIAFTSFFDKSLDLFEVGMFDSNTYISEPLKEKIISNKITGCYIVEATNLIV